MSEAARTVKRDLVSIEGMEDVFDLAPVTSAVAPVTGGDAEPVTCAAEPIPGVPVEQAALVLGSSINAIKKRLRKGTIQGFKVETKHGEKWFVDQTELEVTAPVTGWGTEPVTSAPAPVTGWGAEPAAPVAYASEPVPASLADLVDRIRELEAKLEGATFRNGYLEAENAGLKAVVGAKDCHIKLLTDSQHKSGLWRRFWSWFTGNSGTTT